MPKRKIQPATLTQIGSHCKDCTPEKQGPNHSRCWVVSCACIYHRAYSSRKPNMRNATREEQHARYIDCGPNNWDDRD